MIEDNWVIVHCGVENFIGRVVKETNDAIFLEDAFNWNAGIQKTGPNSFGFVRQILPFQPSISISKIEINKHSYVGIERLDNWPEREKLEVFNKIEAQMEAISAASAGIIPPSKGRIQL